MPADGSHTGDALFAPAHVFGVLLKAALIKTIMGWRCTSPT
jgi:hypothetical protein